ncbi:hypothetical protein [Fundicoccus culcitae]|uniref:Transposase n=1 Tax=Fundicoccus culcitae TaxID=2969821 RepID=A0ABY5PA30_9LACT|nr:hypothetical protein [Fundicoccus culcitae]UUX35218.1 hypothetical protein NRE15_06130 [Fundicoccus culcitae]
MSQIKLVELPAKKISFKKGSNGTKYVYYTVKSYRNEKGNPTSDEVSIGKLDEHTSKLIPNKSYYEGFPIEREDTPERIQSTGYISIYFHLAERIALTFLLKQNFPEQADSIFALAAYMMAHGNVMMIYERLTEDTQHKHIPVLSSQQISTPFANFAEEHRNAFLKE